MMKKQDLVRGTSCDGEFRTGRSANKLHFCAEDFALTLEGFQADLSFLLGAGFADPDHPAALDGVRVLIEDKFDCLTALKVETSAQPETF